MRDAGNKAGNVLSAGEGRHGGTIRGIGAKPAGELSSALPGGLFVGAVPGFAAAADGSGLQVVGDGKTFGGWDFSGHEFLRYSRMFWDVSFIVRAEGVIICNGILEGIRVDSVTRSPLPNTAASAGDYNA